MVPTLVVESLDVLARPTPWQLAHGVESYCRTCGILTWGEADDHDSVRFRGEMHRRDTGHDVELRWNQEDWPCALVAEVNGVENEDWWK